MKSEYIDNLLIKFLYDHKREAIGIIINPNDFGNFFLGDDRGLLYYRDNHEPLLYRGGIEIYRSTDIKEGEIKLF